MKAYSPAARPVGIVTLCSPAFTRSLLNATAPCVPDDPPISDSFAMVVSLVFLFLSSWIRTNWFGLLIPPK